GVLVVYGKEPNEVFDFIKLTDMFANLDTAGASRAVQFAFSGENALMKSLDFVTSGKAKAKVYFLQGHGELEVSNRNVGRLDEGMGLLFDELGKGNVEPTELRLGQEETSIP